MEKRRITLKEASHLSTPRLLTYYKKKAHNWQHKYQCPNCGSVCEAVKEEYNFLVSYWSKIKEELNTREHVET